ncbi:hypothetical protein IAU60_005885 [Kwoniella sp. DSM 27419]
MKTAALIALLPLVAYAAPWGDYQDKHEVDTHDWKDSFPFHFTSTLVAYGSPDTIVNNSQVAVPGLPEGWAKFQFGLDSKEDNITGWIRGNYSSPAVTATHIHEAVAGRAGPPRIAFPNPQPKKGENQDLDQFSWRESLGCKQGPFTTGVVNNGTDSGTGFTIAKLEENPEGFFADTHTVQFPAGAVRGQIEEY